MIAGQIDVAKVLQAEVEKQVREAIEAEVDKAAAAVKERLRGEVARIALRLLDFYEVSNDGRRIVIEVKNRA